ncbi:MAG: DUF1273 family protein [Clostridia bacterium]|nr:DUF1273 family protein [Clostridia bacterium]
MNGIQTAIEIEKANACAFTGHRSLDEAFSSELLEREIENAILLGVTVFFNGMAAGFDLIAAERTLALKRKYPQIKLIACIPYYGQEKSFSDGDKKRYAEILKKADEQVILSERYFRGCMHERNRYMADRADMLIAYCKKDTGGTAFTVKYFQKKYPYKKTVFL